jgi:hypothetical protein
MAQKTAVVRATLPFSGAGATVDLTVTDFGTVSAAIIMACSANTTNNPQDNGMYSIGFWDGTNQRVVAEAANDASASSSDVRSSNDALAVIITSATSTDATFSVTNITDGIRLTMVVDATSIANYVTALLIGGVSAAVGTIDLNNTQDATADSPSLGFEPRLVLLSSAFSVNADQDRATNGATSFGIVDESLVQRSFYNFWRSGQSAGEAACQKYSENRCGGGLVNDAISWGAELTALNADTFTVTTRDGTTTSLMFYLALGGADLSYELETFDTRTTTGDTVLSTSITPESVLLAFTTNTSTTIATDSGANGFSFGLADANGEFSHNVFLEDAADPTNAGSVAQAAAAIDLDSSSAGSRTDLCAGTVALNASNVTLTYTTVDGTARKAFGVVFGAAAAGTVHRKPSLLLLGCGA